MALSFDRQAFIDILTEEEGDIGGVMQQPPAGLWGMPPELLQALTGYDPDVQKNRAEARQVMQELGYGPDSRLKIKVSVRDLPYLRDPAVTMIDQMKQVYIDADLENDRYYELVSERHAQGLHRRPHRRRKWARPRPESPTAFTGAAAN
jgi:peptide/nickel transport system substrate-binding protein